MQLQILSNPQSSEPSFIIGNPQSAPSKKGVAKKRRKRENQSMAHRRRKSRPHRKHRHKKTSPHATKAAHQALEAAAPATIVPNPRRRHHLRNPRAISHQGKHLGFIATKGERKRAVRAALSLRKALRSPNISPELRAKGKARLRELQAQIKKMKAGSSATRRAARKYRHRGGTRAKVVGFAQARGFHRRKRRRKGRSARPGIIGREGNFVLIRLKSGQIKKVRMKKRRRKHGKKSSPHKPRRRRKHSKKSSSSPRKRRRHRKHASAPKRRRRRRHSKKYWAKRHHSGHAHVSLRGLGRRKRRKGTLRRGKRRYSYSVHRRNPEGGSMGNKVVDFLTIGSPREAGFIVGAAAISEPIASLALSLPGVGSLLSSLNTALSSISPNVGATIVPVLPNVIVAALAEFAGLQTGQKVLRDFGRALMITNLVDLGESIGDALSSAAGISGVSYTPISAIPRGISAVPRGLRGVDFTRSMGAVPRGLRGLMPGKDDADFGRGKGRRHMGSYLPSPGGTLSTAADFGRQMADFGGVDFTMSAVPRMRHMGQSHTGDMMFPGPGFGQASSSTSSSSSASGSAGGSGDGIYTAESADHMV
jgi:hypothetical protein